MNRTLPGPKGRARAIPRERELEQAGVPEDAHGLAFQFRQIVAA